MITIHYDFTDGSEVSYAEGLELKDNFKTCCLDFFTTDNKADDVVIVSKNGKQLSRNELLTNKSKLTNKHIRVEHDILKMFKAGAFRWLYERKPPYNCPETGDADAGDGCLFPSCDCQWFI